jgi:hypothetical protein
MFKVIKKIIKFGVIIAPAVYATVKYIKAIDSDSFTEKYNKRKEAIVNNSTEEAEIITEEMHEELKPTVETLKKTVRLYAILFILKLIISTKLYSKNYVVVNNIINLDTGNDVINIFNRHSSKWLSRMNGVYHISHISLRDVINVIMKEGYKGTWKDVIFAIGMLMRGKSISFTGPDVSSLSIYREVSV